MPDRSYVGGRRRCCVSGRDRRASATAGHRMKALSNGGPVPCLAIMRREAPRDSVLSPRRPRRMGLTGGIQEDQREYGWNRPVG